MKQNLNIAKQKPSATKQNPNAVKQNPNTIRARHIFTTDDGSTALDSKDYFWHIPKDKRGLSIKRGDIVLVASKKDKARVIVLEVLRENIEDTGKRYKSVLDKAKDAESLKRIEHIVLPE